jgi:murein DD-endopeptidase MepM/ murein hydrolase activator NlpD
VDEGLDGARAIELSVAPDIAVELRRKGRKLARPGDTLAAGSGARVSRFKDDAVVDVPADPETDSADKPTAPSAPMPRRRPDPSVELERLGARLAAVNAALEQERERRTALAKTLEEERTASRQLRTELGQARVELEVAATARAEASAVEAELDDMRRQLREAQREHEAQTQALSRRHDDATQALAADHAQLTEAHAALQDELRQQTEALEMTREALAAERAETGRLHNRFTQLQKAREQRGEIPASGPAPRSAPGGGAPRAAEPPEAGEARVSRRATSRAAAGEREQERERDQEREPDPTETQQFDVLGLGDELPSEPPPTRRAPRRAPRQVPEPPPWTPPVADRLRPLNPSLRHRTWWIGRLVALIVLCGVIVAVYLVLHTTVLH